MRARSFAALALAAACTGPQSQLTKLTPELVVAPDELVFGDVIIDQTAELVSPLHHRPVFPPEPPEILGDRRDLIAGRVFLHPPGFFFSFQKTFCS